MIQELERITNVFLNENIDYLLLSQAIKDYKKFLLNLSGINLEEETNRKDLHFENGKAIGTTWAAMCVDDILRTKCFIKGVYHAVKHLRDKEKKTVHILYAGTGPFATLVLPLITKFSSEEVQYTFLEINDESFSSLKRVISKLNFGSYVKIIEQADATKYKVKEEETYDILLSETMQRGLVKEQQVPIVANLLSQLSKDIILIPEQIDLDVGLISWKKREEQLFQGKTSIDYYKIIGDLFELDKGIINHIENGEIKFSEICLNFPENIEDDFNQLCIITTIKIFGEEILRINESGLTIPLILDDFDKKEEKRLLKIKYKVDAEPGIEYCIE